MPKRKIKDVFPLSPVPPVFENYDVDIRHCTNQRVQYQQLIWKI